MRKQIHILLSKNTDMRTGVCQNCGPVDIRLKVDIWRCFNSIKQHRGIYPSGKKRGPHGLTGDESRNLKSGKCCAICADTEFLVIDHCHDTMALRGILCRKCNAGLGQFKDDPRLLQRAAKYLVAHSKKQTPLIL